MRRIAISLRAICGATTLLACVLGSHARLAAAAGLAEQTGDVERVVELTNARRQAAGLSPLALSPQLREAAQNYSQVLAARACFDHVCGAVPNFAERLGAAGYTGWTAIAENIAAGYRTPDAVVAGWMASGTHRANLLSAAYSDIGVGLVSGGTYGTYWTQEFGSRPEVTLTTAAALRPAATPPNGAEP